MSDVNTAGESADDGIEFEGQSTELPQVEKPVEPVATDEDTDHETSEKKKTGWARQRDRLRNENEQLKAELAKLSQPKPVAETSDKPEGRPKAEDFTDVFDYIRADNEWLADERIKAYDKNQKDALKTEAETKEYDKKVESYRERADAIIEKVPDFYQRVDELYTDGIITPNSTFERAVLDSDVPELVTLYFLANPDELDRVNQMPEKQAYRAVALIEAKVNQSQSEPVVKPTKAAAPITPIGKNASTSTKSVEDMDQAEFEAYAAKLKSRK